MATPGHHLSNFANFCNFVSILLLFICFFFPPLSAHTQDENTCSKYLSVMPFCFPKLLQIVTNAIQGPSQEDKCRQQGISSVRIKDGLLHGVGFVRVSPLPTLLTLSNREWITCNSPRASGEIGKKHIQLANWSLIPTVKKWAHLGVPIPATQLIAMTLCC